MGKDKVILKSFSFEAEPNLLPRTPYYDMSEDELTSISKYPFISLARTPFVIDVVVNGTELTLRGVIPKGFSYNLADIPWFVEPLAYDKHSPFVKNASFIHDYLVSHKRDLYEHWNLAELGVSPQAFRQITSLVFCSALKHNAVPYGKAQLMTFFVDLWQSIIPSWRTLNITETAL